jgi:hypothetical protein
MSMLFILIPLAWLATLTLLVTLCRTAAQGDAALSPSTPRACGEIGLKLTLAPQPAKPTASTRRPHRRPMPRRVATAAARRRLTAHVSR